MARDPSESVRRLDGDGLDGERSRLRLHGRDPRFSERPA
jgi:hypothetical protein